MDALEFAKQYSEVSDADIRIIMHSCKSILSYDNRIWRKKNDPDLFDVPMGSFHGAEVCDIIGLFLLHKLSQIFKEQSYGLYRDDGLAILDWAPPRELDNLRKKAISIMLEAGFKITIEIGHTKTDFLDVTLDLYNDTFRPFRKPNSSLSYIHKSSNHPFHIKTVLPYMVEDRLRSLSKCEAEFDNAAPIYDHALKKSGYQHKLTFSATTTTEKKRRNRKRKCIYYNPPYCQSAKTNIGKSFLNLIDKHFGKDHDFHHLFNRSTVKISYCCMPNAKSIIQSHNKRILAKEEENTANVRKMCNCPKRMTCPLNGFCLSKNVIYEAKITTESSSKIYIGSTGNTFKSRFNTHTFSFNHEGKNETELSKYIWSLKNTNEKFTTSWRILRTINGGGSSTSRACSTCNLEKLEIALANKRDLLNSRSELCSMCPHFKKQSFGRLPKNN
jgi:hypothetical protein